MKLTEMTIIHAAITEKAAGAVAEEYDNLDLSGQDLDPKEIASQRATAREAERNAWRNHHKVAYEATKRFLKEIQGKGHGGKKRT